MTRLTKIQPEFVTFAPQELEPGVVYVSMEYATVLHLCCCGCGNQVVTPLAPARWHLAFDGDSISLKPSIGNWSFPCQSHYWIRQNKVLWDRRFSDTEIASVRARDQHALHQSAAPEIDSVDEATQLRRWSWIARVRRFFSR
jgi:hypothetical protein